MLLNCLAVGAGGFAGSILRYLCNLLRFEGIPFPVITFGINIIGSFAIMLFAGLLLAGGMIDGRLSLFLRVGLCGGFTTFSTFSAEALGLFESGDVGMAVAYAIASCVCCVLAAFAGQAVADAIVAQSA